MPWEARKAVSVGVSHQKRGLVCQDYGDYRIVSDRFLGAVADGAGSAKYSDAGAEIAVKFSLYSLEEKITRLQINSQKEAQQLFITLLHQVREQLTIEAKKRDCKLNDLACTLLLLWVTPNWIAAMQIGDGFIVIKFANDDNYQLLFPPDKGEYANETTFTTSQNWQSQMRVYFQHGQSQFICASTDGLERLAIRLSDWSPFPGFFEPLENYLKEPQNLQEQPNYLQELLDSERLNQRTDDDKTLLIGFYDPRIQPPVKRNLDEHKLKLPALPPTTDAEDPSQSPPPTSPKPPSRPSSQLEPIFSILAIFLWGILAGFVSHYILGDQYLLFFLILTVTIFLTWILSFSSWSLRMIFLSLGWLTPIFYLVNLQKNLTFLSQTSSYLTQMNPYKKDILGLFVLEDVYQLYYQEPISVIDRAREHINIVNLIIFITIIIAISSITSLTISNVRWTNKYKKNSLKFTIITLVIFLGFSFGLLLNQFVIK